MLDLQTGGPYDKLTWILQPGSATAAAAVGQALHEEAPPSVELAVLVTVLEIMTVFESVTVLLESGAVDVDVAVAGTDHSLQLDPPSFG